MSTLNNERVKEIVARAAQANNVNFADIGTESAVDSTGADALVVTIVLTPGSSEAIRGERSARTISQVVRELADAGEDRFPIVRYEEKLATSRS